MRESTSTHWHFHFVVWQGEPCSAPLVGRWWDFTSSMLSVTAGTAIFLSTVICLGVAVGSIYWGWFYRERQKRGWGWGDAFLWSRMWQPGALSVSKSREREVSLIAGKTCIPLEFNESGAGVRLCEWVSLGWRQREREKVFLDGPSSTAEFGVWRCRYQKPDSIERQIWANTWSGDLSASICRRRQTGWKRGLFSNHQQAHMQLRTAASQQTDDLITWCGI